MSCGDQDYRVTQQDRGHTWSGGTPNFGMGHYGDNDATAYGDGNITAYCYIDPEPDRYYQAQRDADEHLKAIANSHAAGLASVRQPVGDMRRLPAGMGRRDVACAHRPARRWGGARADR